MRSRNWLRSGLHTLAADLLHTVLPSDCRICAGPMLGLSPVRVCEACVARVRLQADHSSQLCSRCGDALGMESARFAAARGMSECTGCRMNPPAFRRAVAFAAYDNQMREMLHALKFGRVRRVAETVLSGFLAEAMLQLEPETRDASARTLLVVPVPLFGARQRERGYNQAELLAIFALRRLRKLRPGWRLELKPGALRRVRDTKAMFQLRPDQRRRNLVGAFEAEVDVVRGREVLLVDDILTTGATANQCAKALLKAGAKTVWVATVARAQPEGVSLAAGQVARWDAGAVTGFRSATADGAEPKADVQQLAG